MNYSNIIWPDTANGLGTRVSLLVSGCSHHGKKFSQKTVNQILGILGNKNCSGLSLLGDEPMDPAAARELEPFVFVCKEKFPEKKIWAWSGYRFEELFAMQNPILLLVDVLVDGLFAEAEKKRIIGVPKSIL